MAQTQTATATAQGVATIEELRAKYDPTNFFRLNQNIPPAR